jgi:hypothetical protein
MYEEASPPCWSEWVQSTGSYFLHFLLPLHNRIHKYENVGGEDGFSNFCV